jgi:hypothetical protein
LELVKTKPGTVSKVMLSLSPDEKAELEKATAGITAILEMQNFLANRFGFVPKTIPTPQGKIRQ